MNNLGFEVTQNLENLNNYNLQHLNDYNQLDQNEDINKLYQQSPIQENFEDLILNQNIINNDNNNQIDENDIEVENSNMNIALDTGLNNINLFNSAFTFGDPQQQLKDSLTGSYTNPGESYGYNYSYFSLKDSIKNY